MKQVKDLLILDFASSKEAAEILLLNIVCGTEKHGIILLLLSKAGTSQYCSINIKLLIY